MEIQSYYCEKCFLLATGSHYAHELGVSEEFANRLLADHDGATFSGVETDYSFRAEGCDQCYLFGDNSERLGDDVKLAMFVYSL